MSVPGVYVATCELRHILVTVCKLQVILMVIKNHKLQHQLLKWLYFVSILSLHSNGNSCLWPESLLTYPKPEFAVANSGEGLLVVAGDALSASPSSRQRTRASVRSTGPQISAGAVGGERKQSPPD